MTIFTKQAVYKKIQPPVLSYDLEPVGLTDETMAEHKQKILNRMREKGLAALLVYADREHGDNFEYLTGFSPRFEEAALILHEDGRAFLLLGNEMLRMEKYSRIKAAAIHVPYFSLPNQPMETEKTMKELIAMAGIKQGMKTGVAGWKLFTGKFENCSQMYDVPHFITEAVKGAAGDDCISSEGGIFIHPERGARILVNANEIAHYEFGAALASCCVGRAMNENRPGRTEMEVADYLSAFGQQTSVQTICAAGERFTDGVVVPRNKKILEGDKFSITMGFPGGLTSRSGFVVSDGEGLLERDRDYIEHAVKPYYRAAAVWYETVGLGVTGEELYAAVDRALPKEFYRWELNPGHLTSSEEWMCSLIEKDSQARIKSGMMFQMDIIPKRPGYSGASAEDGVVMADKGLRDELQETYPKVWKRMQRRRAYMENELGMDLKEELLPMSDLTGYLRPYLLNREWALCLK